LGVQWSLILGLIFALIVAIFAVANVGPVEVNYIVGVQEIPLILVIISSALLGGLVVGMFGIFRQYKLQWKVSKMEKELAQLKPDQAKEAEQALPAPVTAQETAVTAPQLVTEEAPKKEE
jgi:putative membrane protein